MKARHDGDCTIYAVVVEGIPESGICTCGYGHQRRAEGDHDQMYSPELERMLRIKNGTADMTEEEIAKKVGRAMRDLTSRFGGKKDE